MVTKLLRLVTFRAMLLIAKLHDRFYTPFLNQKLFIFTTTMPEVTKLGTVVT